MQNRWDQPQQSTTNQKPTTEQGKYALVGELVNEKLGRKKLFIAEKAVTLGESLNADKPTLPENIIMLEQLKRYCKESFSGKFAEDEAAGKVQISHIMDFIAKNGDRRLDYTEIVAGAEALEQQLANKKKYKLLYREDMKKLPTDTPDKLQALLDIYAERNDYISKNKTATVKGIIAGNLTLKQIMMAI
jgi:hypothetical protein